MSARKKRKGLPALPPSQAHKGYPRASSFYAYSNCAASFALSLQSGDEPPTPQSDHGTAVHAVISGKVDRGTVEEEVLEEADALKAQKQAFFDQWVGADYAGHVEERLWMRFGTKLVCSGQPDEWGRSVTARNLPGPVVALSDIKTGWHPFDEIVATNSQIRAYAGLIYQYCGNDIDRLVAAIHKPGHPLSPAIFDRVALEESLKWTAEVATIAIEGLTMSPPPKPNRGPWCKYCAGKVLCPLWKDEVMSLSSYADISVAELPDSQLRAIAPYLDQAAAVVERLQLRLRHRVNARPDFFSDWRLEPGVARRRISDTIAAFKVLCGKDKPLDAGSFLSACRVSVTDLQIMLRKALGITSRAAADYMDKELAEGILDRTKPEPKLVYDPKELPK